MKCLKNTQALTQYQEKGIRGMLPLRTAGVWFPLGGAVGRFFQIHLEKKVMFLTAPACRKPAAPSSLSDEHSRPTAAVRGVLAALADFRQTGTVRNIPFLRLDLKKPPHRPAQRKPDAGRPQREACPGSLFPSSLQNP